MNLKIICLSFQKNFKPATVAFCFLQFNAYERISREFVKGEILGDEW